MEKHHIRAAVSKAADATTQVKPGCMFCFWMRAWRVMVRQKNTGNRDVIRGRKMRIMLLSELNE